MKLRLFKLLIIPLLLTIGYAILLSYPYFFSKINRYDSLGPLSLVEEKSVNIQKTFSPERKTDKFDNHLLKGEKITTEFKASENSFGILLFRFAKLANIVSDKVVFRLKEEGAENWYYENKYNADQFQDNQYFTFGFPSIINSKNNFYVFEIESLSGTYKNGVGISLDEPQTALVYKYAQSDLKNLNTLSSFIFKKLVYVSGNINYWQVLITFIMSLFFVLLLRRMNITVRSIVRFLQKFKDEPRKFFRLIIKKIKFAYLSQEKKIVSFSKKTNRWFTSTKFYLLFLNTNMKKRLAIGLLVFLLALTYRFTSSLFYQDRLFYAGLGGQGDYDQFIRAATCAVKNFCPPAILGQNFLFEASILGVFFKVSGFTGALKAYLYLMLILSSIVATLPYILFSRKNWISLGGIIGSVFLATSDFLTNVALNFPPDNGSLFTFSMFYIVYLLAINIGTIRWLLFFGLMGTIDGFNKALFLINDLAVFVLFVPIFFYEKAKKKGESLFREKNIKILLAALIPVLVFIILYSAWEYFVYVKWAAHYFLGELVVTRAGNFVSYTSFNDSSLSGNIVMQLFYLSVSAIVMIKRLIEFADLRMILLAPIFLGLFFFTFVKKNFPSKKFISMILFSGFIIVFLILIRENYFKIHDIFPGEYILYNWKWDTYVGILLFLEGIFLFILNFKYSAIKFSLPIIPYVIMLIILTKNSPFARLHTHVVAWSVILLAYIIDFLMMSINRYSTRIRAIFGPVILILFLCIYILPKMIAMVTQLSSGIVENQNEGRYLRWVEKSLPPNAVILAGGKSDLVTVAENIKKPIIYNSLWNAALLIKPKEIPGVKSSDFHVLSVLKINEIPGVKPNDFSIIPELQNKDNFRRNKYIILEDDIYIWRDRLTGVADNVFSTSPNTLHGDDYSIKVYKFNSALKKAIYELNTRNLN